MSTWTGEIKSYPAISRRTAVVGAFLIAGGAALGLTKAEDALRIFSPKRPSDKFVDLVDGKPVVADKPAVVKVSYFPVEGNTPFADKINITVRRKASTNSKEQLITPDKLPRYAARVLGEGYLGNPSGRVSVQYDSSVHNGGIWFIMTDSLGNLIKPDGRPLEQYEDPYYVAGNFVTVQTAEKQQK